MLLYASPLPIAELLVVPKSGVVLNLLKVGGAIPGSVCDLVARPMASNEFCILGGGAGGINRGIPNDIGCCCG